VRGNERRRIFGDEVDHEKLLGQPAESQALYEVAVHAYVLMTNHFHFSIKTKHPNLQKFKQFEILKKEIFSK